MDRYNMRIKLGLINLFLFFILNLDASSVSIELEYDNNIFPSFIYASTNFNDKTHLLGYQNGSFVGKINSPIKIKYFNQASFDKPINIDIVVRASELAKETRSSYKIKKNGLTVIKPALNYNFKYLVSRKQIEIINLKIDFFENKKLIKSEIISAKLHGVNSAPYWLPAVGRTEWIWGVYINENDPILDKILEIGKNKRFLNSTKGYNGYQRKTAKSVEEQVFNIWLALARSGVTYSSITDSVPITPNGLGVTHIRFPQESFNRKQANCADGSILFASILKKIGIKSYIMHNYNHMYVCYKQTENSESIACLETTMVSGSKNLGSGRLIFNVARKKGDATYKEDFEKMKLNKDNYSLVDVDKLRDFYGVVPLPFED